MTLFYWQRKTGHCCGAGITKKSFFYLHLASFGFIDLHWDGRRRMLNEGVMERFRRRFALARQGSGGGKAEIGKAES